MASSSQSINLLIVEDDSKVSTLLQAFFQEEGYSVTTAANGAEALSLLHKKGISPHLIISDIMMPEMDGFQLCRILKDDKALAKVPFLFLSGMQHPDSQMWRDRAGADDYLTKPFSMEELGLKVRRLLERRSLKHPQAVFCFPLKGVATWMFSQKAAGDSDGSAPECLNRKQCDQADGSGACPLNQVHPV